MGLETVEILMDIEDHFEVSVPEEVAGNCITVGDLHRELVKLLREQGRELSPQLEKEVYEGIVAVIIRATGLRKSEISMESRWVGDITLSG